MNDYISRQAAIDRFQNLSYDDWNQGVSTTWANAFSEAADMIEDLPSVEAEPVRHGHWDTVEDWDGDEHYQCSECGAEFVLIDGTPEDNDYLYCPHCGADMRGEQNGTD